MAAESVGIRAARTRLSKLVDKAAAGHEIVITRAGRPVARLVPLASTGRRRKLGALEGKLAIPDDFDAPVPAEVIAAFD